MRKEVEKSKKHSINKMLYFGCIIILISTITSANPTCTNPTYRGCFTDPFQSPDKSTHRVLNHSVATSDKNMTQSKCIALCCKHNFKIGSIAGVESGSDCYCDNNFGPYTIPASTQCNLPCTGDSKTNCGGKNAIATFTINSCPGSKRKRNNNNNNNNAPSWMKQKSLTPLQQCGTSGCTKCPISATCCIGKSPDSYKVPGGYGCAPANSNNTTGCASGGILPNNTGCCCGPGPSIISSTLKNVLIVGDSVSAGYLPFVRAALNTTTNIQHGPDNTGGGNADGVGYGKLCTKYFVRTPEFILPPWNLITFNYGLHDGSDTNHSYVLGLSSIADQLLETVFNDSNKLLYFMTTIPGGAHSVPGEPVSPSDQRVIELNSLAVEIMNKRNITYVDLYATMEKCGVSCYSCKPHCNAVGYEYLVKHAIVPGIQKMLKSPSVKSSDNDVATKTTKTPPPQFELNRLTAYPTALCLDGSPGAYYTYQQENVDSWLIYIEGGAWCFTAESCANRAKTQLGSSLTYPKNFSRDRGHGNNPVLLGGITSGNCTVNPTFCQHNVVFVKYCDGASFTGSTTNSDLHYRGFDILTAILTDLKVKHNINAASEVLLTGGSAGAMSVFLHADYIHESLELQPGSKFGAVPLSGFFLDRVNVYDEPVYHGQVMGMFALANSSAGLPQRCVAERPNDPSSCIFSEHAYNSMESSIFVVDSTLDAYQIPCILGRNGTGQTWANSTCGSARGYENCTKVSFFFSFFSYVFFTDKLFFFFY